MDAWLEIIKYQLVTNYKISVLNSFVVIALPYFVLIADEKDSVMSIFTHFKAILHSVKLSYFTFTITNPFYVYPQKLDNLF